MKIQVTQEDIQNGKKFDSEKCPWALACLRTLNMTWKELWQKFTVDPFEEHRELARFITAFDKGQPVEPIEVEIPDYIWQKEK